MDFALLCVGSVTSQDDFGEMSEDAVMSKVVLQHSFGGEFRARGTIQPKSTTSSSATITQEFTEADATELYNLAKVNGDYLLRVLVTEAHGSSTYAQTFVSACTLFLSGSQTTLYDSIMVHVDGAGRPQGLTVSVGADKKCGADLKPRSLQKFKTKVSIKRAEGGPTPFLDKFREELQKRVPGREGEAPQGFFSKYWMYIVPAYLFITLMGNGGGGDAKGGAAASA